MPQAECQQELDAHYNLTLPSTSTRVMGVHSSPSLTMIHLLRLCSLQCTRMILSQYNLDCDSDLSYYFVLLQSDPREHLHGYPNSE